MSPNLTKMYMKKLFNNKKDIIVFSHIKWESLKKRPQLVISKLAKSRKVLFVEEPIEFAPAEEKTVQIKKINRNICVMQPKIAQENINSQLPNLIKQHLKKQTLESDPILWFYSPIFEGVTNQIDNSMVIYDCMQDFSTNEEIAHLEKRLLNKADVVLTDSEGLYEIKKTQNHNTHYIPTWVDRYHYEQAFERSTKIPGDIAAIKPMIMGYVGTIDSRIDFDLLKKIATRAPQISFVMIGPVQGINTRKIPKLPNIHFLGEKTYEELPGYLKAIDIALIPFLNNEETQNIRPLKTLEYLAARKRVISTKVKQITEECGQIVSFISDENEFVDTVNKYIHEGFGPKVHREFLQDRYIRSSSWDKISAQIENLINTVLDKQVQDAKDQYKAEKQYGSVAKLA